MQLIDFRKDTCEVYIGAYYGKDCNNPENEAQWVVTHYFVDGGVVKAEQVKYIAWDNRETATYSPHEIDQGNIPSVILDNLLNCGQVASKSDYELTCVEENDLLHYLKFNTDTNTYLVFDINGTDVTGNVTPIQCSNSEKYDIVYAGDYCDGGVDLSRYDIIDLSDKSIQGSYFTNNIGSIVTPVNPIKGICGLLAVQFVYGNWLPLCVDGAQWYVREISTYDNVLSIIDTVYEYKLGSDGTIVNIAPTGTIISEGLCQIQNTYSSITEMLTINTQGQTIFTLNNVPNLSMLPDIDLVVNNGATNYGFEYTISGSTLVWNNANAGYQLDQSDILVIRYYF